MTSVWNKIDSGLASIYSNYLRVQELGPENVPQVDPVVAAGGKLNVSLEFTGDLAAIEALGFQTRVRKTAGLATGTVHLADLERLAQHPGVVKMSFGRAPDPLLDKSTPDIRAREVLPAAGVWRFTGGAFSGTTGRNVVVGVIDTGIDFRHPFFFKTTGPNTTKILRIWDPGIGPHDGIGSPSVGLLTGGVGAAGGTYGVEYTDVLINNVLQGVAGAKPVKHRDCSGHGTHVASIAAGNGGSTRKFIGVAPEADLVIVKYLYLQTHPQVGGAFVSYEDLFQDAVSYILNVAASLVPARPVVINYSVGSNLGPHDGFTLDEDFLTHTFSGATGKVFVSAAGNSAGRLPDKTPARQHARIEFPVGGTTVEIPLELYDPRTNRRDFNHCRWENATKNLYIQLYYPDGATNITAELDIPLDGAGYIAGPAFGGAEVSGTFGGRVYKMRHSADNQTLSFTGRGTVNRKRFEIEIEPYRNRHRLGKYMLKVSCPGKLTVHLWCGQARGHGFKIGTAPPLPAAVVVEDKFLIGSDAGADNILSVAAFNAEVATLDVAEFSSRGPLVRYGGPAQPAKPDIAAPGVRVDAAKSRDARPPRPGEAVPKSGTSMSAPHVAGAVALLLQSKPALTVTQVITTLKTHRRTAPPATADEVGAGRLDAKDAFDHIP